LPLTQTELDAVYALDYDRAQHPFYEQQGKVKALETIKFAIPPTAVVMGSVIFAPSLCTRGVPFSGAAQSQYWRKAGN